MRVIDHSAMMKFSEEEKKALKVWAESPNYTYWDLHEPTQQEITAEALLWDWIDDNKPCHVEQIGRGSYRITNE